MTDVKIIWETTQYPMVCECCDDIIPKRRRVMHIIERGNHTFVCKECSNDPYMK